MKRPRPLAGPARLAATALSVLVLASACSSAGAATVDEITVDWAYYNPVSLVLRETGILDDALAAEGITVNWVQSDGSNKAIEFLNSGSVEFGSTAGAAALLARINGSPIRSVYTYSKPEWTALVTSADSGIESVEQLAGRRVAVTRGTDPYIFLIRALGTHGLSEADIEPVLLQHADGRNALIAGQVDAWAGLDPMMAQAELEQGARLFYRDPDANTYGILNVNEEFASAHPEVVDLVLGAYEEGRAWALENPDALAAILAEEAGLTSEVAAVQLERTGLLDAAIGDAQRTSILAAAVSLQESGVIEADVDVEAAVDELLDSSYTESLGGPS